MRCRSVACIWSGAPPAHRVTATAVLDQPPTLYTGGSDGSILWWNLSFSDSESEIKPVAMLCGHAAAIADLAVCSPVVVSGDSKEKDYSSNSSVTTGTRGALLSVCTDGVMCVWSRSSGHCRRRRKLPPWVGSPTIVRTMPTSSRYVCIGCCSGDPVHVPNHHSVNSSEGNEASADRDFHHRKPPKCTVVIVDTYSLAIVQTVHHGNSGIGPMKFLDLVLLGEDGEKHSVFFADLYGRVQLVPILNDSDVDGELASELRQNSQWQILESGLNGEPIVSVATSGNLIALVMKDRCIFRLLSKDITIGQISFLGSLLLNNDSSTQLGVIGGLFIGSGDVEKLPTSEEPYERFEENIALWNAAGSTVVYYISFLSDVFKCEALCQIPAASLPGDGRLEVSFSRFKNKLLRIESKCFDNDDPLRWNAHVTVWSPCHKFENYEKLPQCKMFGESDLLADWISSSDVCNQISDHGGQSMRISSSQNSVSSLDTENNKYAAYAQQTVTASMVISDNLILPYAIVYGFGNGDIKIVRFGTILGLDSQERSPRYDVNSHASGQYVTGHTGAVLCLAAHQMFGTAKGRNFKQVLVSGSMDCTIRIWDLDSCSLITVLHQHAAPVRQIIFPPAHTERPWSDCFLAVGEDLCVSLTSLETLRVERMFPGHPSYPEKVVWDGRRGYIACLCPSYSGKSDAVDALYIWDVKTGAQERILRGTASHSMLDHFCKGISANSISGAVLNGNTSVSSLLLPIIEDGGTSQFHINHFGNRETNILEPTTSQVSSPKGTTAATAPYFLQNNKNPIRCTCPFPGIATLTFDLASLMLSSPKHGPATSMPGKQETNVNEQGPHTPRALHVHTDDSSNSNGVSTDISEVDDWVRSLDKLLLRFSLSFLHLWNFDCKLDKVLMMDMELKKPENFILSSGLQGDKGSLTLMFPGLNSNLELWKSSPEFSALRSLMMLSIAQRMISLSSSSSVASSDLAAFYARNFAEQMPDMKPPLLQLLVSFWQDESEYVRMAARTLFHCSASRAIPSPLCGQRAIHHAKLLRCLSEVGKDEGDTPKVGISTNGSHHIPPSEVESSEVRMSTNGFSSETSPNSKGKFQEEKFSDESYETQGVSEAEESEILAWLESFEVPDWISCVGGTSQDAMTSHIIVAAALAIWYPSLVKPSLATLVVHPLIKLVMAMNGKYSSTAAELLAEGMESTWKACISSEIPHLISDIFFQIECVSGPSAASSGQYPSVPSSIREILVETLLPSLAMADILGFLNVIESQIWSTASDSPVHVVALTTVIRVVRGSPRYLAQYLDKVVNFILHTMDPGNSVMRKTCRQSSVTALKEVVRVFPMVALNDSSTRLAVGDAIGGLNNASISVYDMQSVTKVKILDASGPPGLPALLSGASESAVATVISALSFSPDGEGLIAFSEHGLMIRWWSLGSVWWEKLSRNLTPVPCTKLILVPPWEGFSPNSSRSSVMATIMAPEEPTNLQENARSSSFSGDNLKMILHNLDLSYRLEWVGDRKVVLSRQGVELGTFPL